MVGWWRRFHSEELHNVSFAPNNSRMMEACMMIGCDRGNVNALFLLSSGKVSTDNSV